MSIVLERLTKRFGTQRVVDDVSLEIGDGELFVLLGASGSGKSTILRLVAGLARPENGRILLHGRDVTAMAPQHRGTGFVFQNYSIFRQMTVAENVEFGLRIRGVSRRERAQRRDELLEQVGLAGLGNRHADQLSGGQQQRVAIARALAYQPGVLLLDEPFGALDVKIRGQLRRSLREVQRRLKLTAILVTHDQEEAFELGDRVGVIERGRLIEVGPPEELYARPRTLFTATFLGAGTVLLGRAAGGHVRLGPLALPIPADMPHEDDTPVQVLVRPEEVELHPAPPEGAVLGRGEILERSFAGAASRVRLRVPRLEGTRQIAPVAAADEPGTLVDALIPASQSLANGEAWVALRTWRILEAPTPSIVVWDRGRGSAQALEVARELGWATRSSLTVLGVARDIDDADGLGARLLRRQRRHGLAFAERRVRLGAAGDQILREQAEALHELIIAGARRGWLGRRARQPDPVLIELMDRSHVPVLVADGERPAIERILVWVGPEVDERGLLRPVARLAARVGARVSVLDTTADSSAGGAVTTLASLGVQADRRARPSDAPAQTILTDLMDGHFDAVALGVVRGGADTHPARSVALEVLDGAERSVLLVGIGPDGT